MTAQHAYQLARNSFEASFLDESAKRHHIDKLKEVFENFE
jgi:adenosine deaminase